jgi:hypothetical protein
MKKESGFVAYFASSKQEEVVFSLLDSIGFSSQRGLVDFQVCCCFDEGKRKKKSQIE